MEKVQILGAPQSPYVWATRMAAHEKGIDAKLVVAGPHSPEINALQPFGKIPAMRHGAVQLAELRAIALYFDSLTSQNPLFPRDPLSAARTEQWIMHLYTEFSPVLLGQYVALYFFPRTADGQPDRAAIDASLPKLTACMSVLERQLEGRDFVAGAFSFADLLYAPLLHYVNALPEGGAIIAANPLVTAYLARMSRRPSYQATFPPPMPARVAA